MNHYSFSLPKSIDRYLAHQYLMAVFCRSSGDNRDFIYRLGRDMKTLNVYTDRPAVDAFGIPVEEKTFNLRDTMSVKLHVSPFRGSGGRIPVKPEEMDTWLEKQIGDAFSLDEIRVDVHNPHQIFTLKGNNPLSRKSFTVNHTEVSLKVTVKDMELAKKHMKLGIGKHRGFGYGMLYVPR